MRVTRRKKDARVLGYNLPWAHVKQKITLGTEVPGEVSVVKIREFGVFLKEKVQTLFEMAYKSEINKTN